MSEQLKPSDRIAKVAHLLPPEALEDIRTRLGDWMYKQAGNSVTVPVIKMIAERFAVKK